MKTTWKTKLSAFLSRFAPKEYVAVSLAVLVSVPILIYGLASGTRDEVDRGFKPIVATERVYDTNGNRVQLFDTSFYIAYENNASSVEIALVEQVLNEYLVPYHKLFDRHADYFATAVVDPAHPTVEERENTPLIHNVKYINDHIGEFVEVDYPLYDLLYQAETLAMQSQGYFNPFVGEYTDFWSDILDYDAYPTHLDPLVNDEKATQLASIRAFTPTTPAEIDATLDFHIDNDNDTYFVRLNPFNGATKNQLSLTLGGIAKGYLTDVMEVVLRQNKLYRGYINGGSSSITTVSARYFGESLDVSMASIDGDTNPSFRFNRSDEYSMSTSGTYEGKLFHHPDNDSAYLRSHIIDPFTGYPAHYSHQLVSVVSSDLGGTELEILSTSLIVMSQQEGVDFIQDKYTDVDLNVVYLSLENGEYILSRNETFPGGNDAYFHVSETYREKILEI